MAKLRRYKLRRYKLRRYDADLDLRTTAVVLQERVDDLTARLRALGHEPEPQVFTRAELINLAVNDIIAAAGTLLAVFLALCLTLGALWFLYLFAAMLFRIFPEWL